MTSLLALVILAAAPSADVLELEGTVRETRGIKMSRAVLKTDDGKRFTLKGHTPEVQAELARLSGIRVRVQAAPTKKDAPAGAPVKVYAYEILDIGGGLKPQVGQLALLTLEGGDRLVFVGSDGRAHLLPASWNAKLSGRAGAKMWVVGTPKDGELQVRRFGLLSTGSAAKKMKSKKK